MYLFFVRYGGIEWWILGIEVLGLDVAQILVAGFVVIVGRFVVANLLVAVEFFGLVVAEGGFDFLLVDTQSEFLFALFVECALEVAVAQDSLIVGVALFLLDYLAQGSVVVFLAIIVVVVEKYLVEVVAVSSVSNGTTKMGSPLGLVNLVRWLLYPSGYHSLNISLRSSGRFL